MPQSRHTLRPRTGCSLAVSGPRASFASPYGSRRVKCMYYKLTDPVRVYRSWTACEQPVLGTYGPLMAKCDARAGFLQILVGPTRAPYESRSVWNTLEIPERGPCEARTDIARHPCGVLRIILWNHKSTAASGRTGPVAWRDHENSTGVKFLRAFHSALRAIDGTRQLIFHDYTFRVWIQMLTLKYPWLAVG